MADSSHTKFGVESVDEVGTRVQTLLGQMRLPRLPDGAPWMVLLVAHGDVLQIAQTLFSRVDPRLHRSLDHLETATLRKLGIYPLTKTVETE